MKDVLEKHNKIHNIKSFFYCYKKNVDHSEIVDNVLYISGEESYIPGILEKTLEAFEVFKDQEYDYIIRSNISTIINYTELFKYLFVEDFDYGGPLYYFGNFFDLEAGMTQEKHCKYKNCHFVSGICIILSRKTIKLLTDNKKDILSYGLVDDVAIGVYLHDKGLKRKKIGPDLYSFDNSVYKPGYILYRNRSNNREIDVSNMKMIMSQLKY